MNPAPARKAKALLALALGIALPYPAVAQTAPAPTPTPTSSTTTTDENGKEVVKMETFEVTGSRIKRLDLETVSPVIEVSAANIETQGFTTIGDALRALPFNSGQALTPVDAGSSFTPGVSTINLRGLGNNTTLVLINGRRAVPYASPGFDGFQTVFDLNSLPMEALEGIEILKDGGSAIYGSDAVGGVVNFKLRRDYEGFDTSVEVGNYGSTDGFYKRGTVVSGATSAKASIMVAASYEDQNAVFGRDLSYSANADKTDLASRGSPYWSATGWQQMGYKSEKAYLADLSADLSNEWGVTLTDPVRDSWFGLADNRSSRGYPGYVVIDGTPMTFSSPTNTPTVDDAVPGDNPYNFMEAEGMFPKSRKMSCYSFLKYDITDKLYAFAEASFARNESDNYSASTPADLEDSNGLTSGTVGTPDGMHIPSYNPYNPWGEDIYTGRRRLIEEGPRYSETTSDTPRLVVGAGGKILEDWSWEAGAMYSKNTVDSVSMNDVTDYGLQEALMGLTRLSDGSLTWNPETPQASRVYYNWFGENEPAMAKFLDVENPNSASLEYINLDISANGHVFPNLPYGPIGLAIGAEHRQEEFANVRTDLNATGNIVGGDEGTSSFGSRDLSAVYAEADVPILKNVPLVQTLEMQLAGRYEQYSDKGFAKQVRPKVGLKYRPLSWLILRGSYSKSFKAPDLAYLYTSSTTTYTASQIFDPITQTYDQLKVLTGGNPNLKPELTDTYYGGLSIEPAGKLKGLDVTVDWFRFQRKNLLASLTDYYGYDQFLSEAAAGNPLFADKVVRDPDDNKIVYLKDTYTNISTGQYRGVDLSASYLWKTHNIGNIFGEVQSTWIDRLDVDGDNVVGTYLTARWNATADLRWDKGDWDVRLFGVYRGRRVFSADADIQDWGLSSPLANGDAHLWYNYNIRAQYTQNVSVTYRGLRHYELTVGVNNAFNSKPPVDFTDVTGTTNGINDAAPLFWYCRVEMKY